MVSVDRIMYQVKQRAGDRGITAENMESHSIPISMKTRLMKVLVWPVASYGCESLTLRKNEETFLGAFEMKGLRKILRVSWTAKKTNEWVLNKVGVKRELLDTCLLYTSPSPRDGLLSRMPSSA